ncbi:hypothetical protein R52603_00910 [Paraburkholderia saeva]|nr:hypothetical protein R52603_00910 [Paraburkholderia saeva]
MGVDASAASRRGTCGGQALAVASALSVADFIAQAGSRRQSAASRGVTDAPHPATFAIVRTTR